MSWEMTAHEIAMSRSSGASEIDMSASSAQSVSTKTNTKWFRQSPYLCKEM